MFLSCIWGRFLIKYIRYKNIQMECGGPFYNKVACTWWVGIPEKCELGPRTQDPGPSNLDPSPRTRDLGPIGRTRDLYVGPRTWDSPSGTRDPICGNLDPIPLSGTQDPYLGTLILIHDSRIDYAIKNIIVYLPFWLFFVHI